MMRTTVPETRRPITTEEMRTILERLIAGEVYRRFTQRWGTEGLPRNFRDQNSA